MAHTFGCMITKRMSFVNWSWRDCRTKPQILNSKSQIQKIQFFKPKFDLIEICLESVFWYLEIK